MDTLQPQPFSKRLQARIAASRFFTFSLLIHVVIVVMGGSVVLFKHYSEPPDFTAEGGEGLVSQEVQAQPPAEQEQSTPTVAPVTPQVETPQLSVIASTTPTATSFTMPTAAPVIKAPSATTAPPDVAAMVKTMGKGMANGAVGAMGGRIGGKARMEAMQKMGGKEASEKAVKAGLAWLKDHQNEDGSWSNEDKPGLTGLAILCFLGHGELPESPEFGPTVKKGIDWLIDRGHEFNGRMSLTKDGWGGNQGVYHQAICSYAMGEYYSMTQDDRIKDVLTKAVQLIVAGQGKDGGWQYGYKLDGTSDTSVTGWQVQALKAAHLTGLAFPGVDEALDKCMIYFKDAQTAEGTFGYHGKNEERWSLAGVGTLCTYFWKQDKDKLVREGIKYIIEKSKKDFPVEYKSDKSDLYAWYYDTQACLMYGGDAWNRWNRMFQDELVNNQSKDGSWPPLPAANRPGGGLQVKADGGGPFYRTELCILMLEVYYRYMPVNKV